MSEISYFQRYSQRENHTTNNTLLILKYFYQSSPLKIQAILTELLGEEMDIGLLYRQQEKKSDSIPDAHISQSDLNIFIETKRGGKLDEKQIKRHIESIKNAKCKNSFLIGLTSQQIGNQFVKKFRDECRQAGIKFVSLTFLDLVSALKEVCQDYEITLKEILNDYEGYLSSENLLPDGDRLVVVPCGTSIETNIQFNIYFEPSKRPSKVNSRFIGLYTQKCVRSVGEIHTIISGSFCTDTQSFNTSGPEKEENKTVTEEAKIKIVKSIVEGVYPPTMFENEEHRFYLVKEFVDTNFEKSSKYGIWGARVFNVHELLNKEPQDTLETKGVADGLNGKTFT